MAAAFFEDGSREHPVAVTAAPATKAPALVKNFRLETLGDDSCLSGGMVYPPLNYNDVVIIELLDAIHQNNL